MHAHRHPQAGIGVGVGPVRDRFGNQSLVRDQVFDTIAGDDGNVARTEFIHPAVGVLHGDHVAGLDRLVHQQDDAANQVRDNLLQTKTNSKAHGAADDCQGCQVDARGANGDQYREDVETGAHCLVEKHPTRRRYPVSLLELILRNAGYECGQAQEHRQQQRSREDLIQTQTEFAQAQSEIRSFQRLDGLAEQAPDAQHGHAESNDRGYPRQHGVANQARYQADHNPGK